MPNESQDDAVRHYLQALKDPDSLRDDDAISKLQRRLEETEDPLERLKLRAQLERAQQVDPGAYEYGFVAHAKRWARAHGVSAASFKAEGVSDDVLARAGLIEGRRSQRTPATSRRRRVSRDEVRDAMRRSQAFTMRQIQNETGASRETVRAVLNELLDAARSTAPGPTSPRPAAAAPRPCTSARSRQRVPVASRQAPPSSRRQRATRGSLPVFYSGGDGGAAPSVGAG